MFLAVILEMCLLPWPHTRMVPFIHAMVIGQSTQPQDQPNNFSPHGSPPQQPADQPAVQDQSPAPPAAASPCPEKSQPGSTVTPGCKPADSTATKAGKRRRKTVAPADSSAETTPTKKVVRDGGAPDPTVELSSGQDPRHGSQQAEQSTQQLLATSEANLKKLSELQLSASQQDSVKQARGYMDQAKKVASAGDAQRAHSLAVKANSLTETTLFLAPSEANLKKLSERQLNANQQDTVKQIKSYQEQAMKAAGDGDGQRAHNLGVKANLLSAELVKH